MIKEKIVYIDEYGHIVSKDKSKYKVTLNGSYSSAAGLGLWYDIEKIEPFLPIKRILIYEG